MGNDKKKFGWAKRVLRLLLWVLTIACAAYLIWWGVTSYQSREEQRQTVTQYTASSAGTTEPVVDFQALWKKTKAVIGWIQVSGIDVINYPVVWKDDSYYLTHQWDGKESKYGAIFLEESNAIDCSDLHTIIYGHNMKDGSMFGSLDDYAEEAFYQKYGGIITLTLPEETRTYQIFSAEYVNPTEEKVYTVGFSSDQTYLDFLQGMQERSLYQTGVSVTQEDAVLTLSTCAQQGTVRFVVHAKRMAQSK